MRRFLSLLLILSLFLSLLSSCRAEPSAYDMLSEFIAVYGAEGVIYSPGISEGSPGYVQDGMMERIYIFHGSFPKNYAVYLNTGISVFSECGVFLCDDADTLLRIEESCLERVALLTKGDGRGFVSISGNRVFYSTMQEKERAERIWREIIRKY